MEGLHQKCRALADAYPYDIDGDRLVVEIHDCRILVSRRAAVELTPFGILKFIVSFGEGDVLSNLKVGLQILLTIMAWPNIFCCRLRTFVLKTEADFDVPAIDHDREKTDELGYSVH